MAERLGRRNRNVEHAARAVFEIASRRVDDAEQERFVWATWNRVVEELRAIAALRRVLRPTKEARVKRSAKGSGE